MYEGVYFQLRLQLPPDGTFADWTRQVLLHQRERLASVSGFADLGSAAGPGPLPPAATVSDLVIHLRSNPGPGRLLVEIGAWGEDGLAFVHGFLLDRDTYRNYLLPLIYAAAAAAPLGGTGHVSLLGEADDDDDYEDVAIFTDVAGGQVAISEPDPGELTVVDLVARFGEVGADEAYERMLAR